jgi:hypothetical protein
MNKEHTMSKKPSDRERTIVDTASKREKPPFVSDEDILGRTDWLQKSAGVRRFGSTDRSDREPRFVSDDDIVRHRVA